jgi:putative transposase
VHLWKKSTEFSVRQKFEMNQLRDENTRLKRLVADLSLDKVMLQDVLSKALKPAKQRLLAGELRELRRESASICETFRFNRKSMQYVPKTNVINEVLRRRIKEMAQTRVRYGYRRIHVLLRREGWKVNPKRVARLYREEGLSLRAKGPKRRRRSAVQRVRIAATQPNHVWCMDFMHDRLVGDDRKAFRLLTVIDIFTRECVALELANGFRARDVVTILSRAVSKRGKPIAIRCDQGTEFTAEALDQWAYNNGIELDFAPRKAD